jgi:hypothetical protein
MKCDLYSASFFLALLFYLQHINIKANYVRKITKNSF